LEIIDKFFITLAPGTNVIKILHLQFTNVHNMHNISAKLFLPSLIVCE